MVRTLIFNLRENSYLRKKNVIKVAVLKKENPNVISESFFFFVMRKTSLHNNENKLYFYRGKEQ